MQLRSTKPQESPIEPLIDQTLRAHVGRGPRGSYRWPETGSRTGGGGGGGSTTGAGGCPGSGAGTGAGFGSSIGACGTIGHWPCHAHG